MLLTLAQSAIVTAPAGNILVEATAGSGKTRVLTERIRRLLEQDRYAGVLALTFTNKAADEMRDRLATVPDVQTRCFIGTMHSFAQDIVERHGLHIGYATVPHLFERDEDRMRLVDRALRECQISAAEEVVEAAQALRDRDRRKEIIDWLARISEYKRSMLDRVRAHAKFGPDAIIVASSYQRLLDEQNAIDFDDLLMLAYRVLSDAPAVADHYARSYNHVCVDEAQDLNAIQYEILRGLCKGREVTLTFVGDENQAIYGFNGSSSEYMTKQFVADFAPTTYVLTENFRSTKQVLRAANALKPGSQRVELAPLIGTVDCVALPDETAEAEWICAKIDELRALGQHPEIENVIDFASIVILARNRYVLRPVEKRLEELNWPWHLRHTPGAPKFESKLGRIVDLVIRLRLNPRDALHAAELGELLDDSMCSGKTVDEFLNRVRGSTSSVERVMLDTVLSVVDAQLAIDDADFTVAIAELRARFVADSSQIDDEDERALASEDLEEWIRHWDCYVKSCAMGAKLSLSAFRSAMAMGKTHGKSAQVGLALSTVHTMKGAEADIVFLVGMCEGTFPDYRAFKPAQKEEEKNNAFVAVTRARRLLFLTYPQNKRMPWGDTRMQSPSEYFMAIQRAVGA